MSQVLEFYPSQNSCIQGCHHCSRAIKETNGNIITDISNRQRELARNILFSFSEHSTSVSALNLSGYIGEYDFPLFDDIGGMGINQVYFNLGNVGKIALESIKNNITKVNRVLPTNTGDRDIAVFGNLQYVSGGSFLVNHEEIEKFVSIFFSNTLDNINISHTDFTGLMFASNNITEKNYAKLDAGNILQAFLKAHNSLGKGEFTSANFQDFTEQGLILVRSDKIIGDIQTRIDFRGIRAKNSGKCTFLDELKTSLGNDELTLSIFPDTIMVYHSTLNMHIEELFFSYDEFEGLLKNFVHQTGNNRKTLKQIIDERLVERADKLGLFDDFKHRELS